MCSDLTSHYEVKLASLNEALEASREEVEKLLKERERYEASMTKSYMRGVCAINIEAMTMFTGEEQAAVTQNQGYSSSQDDLWDNLVQGIPEKDHSAPQTIPQEAVYTSLPPEYPPARVITGQGSRSSSSVTHTHAMPSSKPSTSASGLSKGKVISAKISARVDTGRTGKGLGTGSSQSLAPPMASVIVVRHQPVTKQTIGQATASKIPRQQTSTAGHIFKRLASQGAPVTMAPHIRQSCRLRQKLTK